jgi:hypothetical protein
MSILKHLQDWFDVVCFSGFIAFWFLWQRRGTTIQKQKVQMQKQGDDAETAPLIAQAQTLDKQLELADADRLEKEARLTARLNGNRNPGAAGSGGSDPLP